MITVVWTTAIIVAVVKSSSNIYREPWPSGNTLAW